MKRRSFLQSVIGGLAALFVGVPKAKAVSKKAVKPVVWRKRWGTLEKVTECKNEDFTENWNPLRPHFHIKEGDRPIHEVPNTRPITEGEIGPIEDMFLRVWTEDECKTIVRERKAFDGKIITERTKLPEPAKSLHIYFGGVIALCENVMFVSQNH